MNTNSCNQENIDYDILCNKLNNRIFLNKLSTFLLFFTIFIPFDLSFLVPVVIAIILKFLLFTILCINLPYKCDELIQSKLDMWAILSNSDMTWEISKKLHINNTRTNAGASTNMTKDTLYINRDLPYYLKSDTSLVTYYLKSGKLLFTPDKILFISSDKISIIEYDNLEISISSIRFVEDGIIAKDAEIVGYTWKYVNNNGSPDRRYKDNFELPICLYSTVKIISLDNFYLEMQVSNSLVAKDFVKSVKKIIATTKL